MCFPPPFYVFDFPYLYFYFFILLLLLPDDAVCIKSTNSPEVFLFFLLFLLSPTLAHGVNSGPVSFYVKMGFRLRAPFHSFFLPCALSTIGGTGSGREVDRDGLGSCYWAGQKYDELCSHLYKSDIPGPTCLASQRILSPAISISLLPSMGPTRLNCPTSCIVMGPRASLLHRL